MTVIRRGRRLTRELVERLVDVVHGEALSLDVTGRAGQDTSADLVPVQRIAGGEEALGDPPGFELADRRVVELSRFPQALQNREGFDCHFPIRNTRKRGYVFQWNAAMANVTGEMLLGTAVDDFVRRSSSVCSAGGHPAPHPLTLPPSRLQATRQVW